MDEHGHEIEQVGIQPVPLPPEGSERARAEGTRRLRRRQVATRVGVGTAALVMGIGTFAIATRDPGDPLVIGPTATGVTTPGTDRVPGNEGVPVPLPRPDVECVGPPGTRSRAPETVMRIVRDHAVTATDVREDPASEVGWPPIERLGDCTVWLTGRVPGGAFTLSYGEVTANARAQFQASFGGAQDLDLRGGSELSGIVFEQRNDGGDDIHLLALREIRNPNAAPADTVLAVTLHLYLPTSTPGDPNEPIPTIPDTGTILVMAMMQDAVREVLWAGPALEPRADQRLPVITMEPNRTGAMMGALLTGILRHDAGTNCLYVETQDGQYRTPVAWAHGTTWEPTAPGRVGAHEVGQPIELGGGNVSIESLRNSIGDDGVAALTPCLSPGSDSIWAGG